MLNQIVLVGRLTKEVQINKTENGKKISNITLAVPRSFKNMNGLYDTDFIDCILWENVAVNTSEYCHKGDILGIKGRVQSRIYQKKYEDGTVENRTAYEVSISSLEVIKEENETTSTDVENQEAV